MAVVVPLIASFASVSAGIAAVGAATTALGTFAAYASIAGGMLGGLGALSGDKDLMKIGGILSIGGALGTAFGGAAGSALSEGAVSEGATQAVSEGGVDELAKAAGGTGMNEASQVGAQTAEAPMSYADLASERLNGVGSAAQPVAEATAAPAGLADSAIQRLGDAPPIDVPPGATATAPWQAGTNIPAQLVDGARDLTQGDMSAWFEKLKGVGNWLGKNPELLKVGGSVLNSMYGPQAEALDYQKSLVERARQNLNNPIRLINGAKP